MCVTKTRLLCARLKITGYFRNMKSCLVNGKCNEFCIKKNVWDTMWPFCKARETLMCSHIEEEQCSVLNCPQKAAHDKYMKLKNSLQAVSQQKVK